MNEPHRPLHLDDPRITAYALGQLSAEEAAQLEAEVCGDPLARQALDQAVGQIRALAELVRASLLSDTPGTSATLREAVQAALAGNTPNAPGPISPDAHELQELAMSPREEAPHHDSDPAARTPPPVDAQGSLPASGAPATQGQLAAHGSRAVARTPNATTAGQRGAEYVRRWAVWVAALSLLLAAGLTVLLSTDWGRTLLTLGKPTADTAASDDKAGSLQRGQDNSNQQQGAWSTGGDNRIADAQRGEALERLDSLLHSDRDPPGNMPPMGPLPAGSQVPPGGSGGFFAEPRAGEGAEQRDRQDADGLFGLQPGPSGGRPSATAPRDSGPAADAETDAPAAEQPGKPSGSGTPRTWRRASATPNASRLLVGEQEELSLQGMQATIQVDGFRARVLLDLHYYNDRNQQLEGTFNLRLPSEASLYFFAFGESAYAAPQPGAPPEPAFLSIPREDLPPTDPKGIMQARGNAWLQPKEARMVPREKAAHAYRETVRQRVDPALVEWAGAGVFSARVFPLQPQKLHRIVVGYEVSLLEVGGDLEYRFDLPEQSGRTRIDLFVTPLGSKTPRVVLGQQAGGNEPSASLTPQGMSAGRWHYQLENPPERTLVARFPAAGTVLLCGAGTEGETFFATRVRVELPAEPEAAPTTGRRAVFLVDTSLSAQPERFNVYLKLLEAVLTSNRDTIPEFAVLFFNVEAHWWQERFVNNTPRHVEELLEHAHSLALEGATDLEQALRYATELPWLQANAPSPECDYFLLSDGAVTWGQRDARLMAQHVQAVGGTLFAYHTGLSGDDSRLLAWVAQQTGGAMFSVVGEAEVAQAARAHRARPWQLRSVECSGARELLVAGRPSVVFPGQVLYVVGRGTVPDDAVLQLHLQRGEAHQVLRIAPQHRLDSDLAPRAYGEVAVGSLEELLPVTHDYAVAYARHFRITGQTCALLMLETEADYERFGIKPEDDVFVVRSTQASQLVADALSQADAVRRDPKAQFVHWLQRMEQMPGLQLQITPALRLAIERLPEEAFRVVPRPLECKLRLWSDLPAAYQDQELSARPLAYEAVTREAQRRLAAGGPGDALKALSSLVELDPGNGVLARDVAYSALEWGRPDQAVELLRRVAEMRPYEPQTYHALADCLAQMGRTDLALLYYEVAMLGQWDARFGDYHQIVAADYLRLLRRIERGELACRLADFAQARRDSLDARYGLGEPDLLVVMSWNTDGTDVDLHVIEPTGEECYYGHRTTRLGGQMSTDVTQGYGPEMYVLRKAVSGKYTIRARYFASDANRASTRTRVFLTIYRHWGTPAEIVQRKTVLLNTGQEVHDVAELTLK
jgi:tetratricopeptide (TPR) repeat protein